MILFVVGHESDRRNWKRLLIRSPVLTEWPCEATKCGHGGGRGAAGRATHTPGRGKSTQADSACLVGPLFLIGSVVRCQFQVCSVETPNSFIVNPFSLVATRPEPGRVGPVGREVHLTPSPLSWGERVGVRGRTASCAVGSESAT